MVRRQPERFDLFDGSTLLEYPDGPTFLQRTLDDTIPTSWLARSVGARVRSLDPLTGARRDAAAAAMADALVQKDSLVAPFGIFGRAAFVSPRLGCRVFTPVAAGLDLAAMCRRSS